MPFIASAEFFDLAVHQAENIVYLDIGDLTEHLGEKLEVQTERRFETKEGPNGEAWPGWSAAYKVWRAGRGSGMMVLSGDLLDSIHLSATDNEATVGSSLVYAGYHQAPSRKSRSRGAKPRPYFGVSLQDQAELGDVVNAFLGGELLL